MPSGVDAFVEAMLGGDHAHIVAFYTRPSARGLGIGRRAARPGRSRPSPASTSRRTSLSATSSGSRSTSRAASSLATCSRRSWAARRSANAAGGSGRPPLADPGVSAPPPRRSVALRALGVVDDRGHGAIARIAANAITIGEKPLTSARIAPMTTATSSAIARMTAGWRNPVGHQARNPPRSKVRLLWSSSREAAARWDHRSAHVCP